MACRDDTISLAQFCFCECLSNRLLWMISWAHILIINKEEVFSIKIIFLAWQLITTQVFQNKLNILIHIILKFWYFVTFCLTSCKLSSFDLFQHFVLCLFNTMLSSNILLHFICTMLKFWSFAMVLSYDLGYDFEIWSSITTHKLHTKTHLHKTLTLFVL